MTTVVVFSSSLFIATAMVIIKAIELRRGKINFLLALFRKFDSHSDKFVAKMKFIALQLLQSARYIILIQIKETCKSLLEKVEKKIAEEYQFLRSWSVVWYRPLDEVWIRNITAQSHNDTKALTKKQLFALLNPTLEEKKFLELAPYIICSGYIESGLF